VLDFELEEELLPDVVEPDFTVEEELLAGALTFLDRVLLFPEVTPDLLAGVEVGSDRITFRLTELEFTFSFLSDCTGLVETEFGFLTGDETVLLF
jgi:hypothetical protein